jgi:putative ABC transport system permease protein
LIANGLTAVLIAVAMVTLAVGGVGIMNIMLANVRARIREIGIRKALGATSREIRLQFLTEAVMISLAGGVVGTILGWRCRFPCALHRLRDPHLALVDRRRARLGSSL